MWSVRAYKRSYAMATVLVWMSVLASGNGGRGLRLRYMARISGQGRHPSHQRPTVRTPGFTPK